MFNFKLAVLPIIFALFFCEAGLVSAASCIILRSSGGYTCCGEDPKCGGLLYCCGAEAPNQMLASGNWSGTPNQMRKSDFTSYFGPSPGINKLTPSDNIDIMYSLYLSGSGTPWPFSAPGTSGTGTGTSGMTTCPPGKFCMCNPIDPTCTMTGGNNIYDLIKKVMGFFLGLALVACPVFIVWGGFEMATANGEEAKITHGKMIITWSLVGLVVIACSNGIIFIIQEIFKP